MTTQPSDWAVERARLFHDTYERLAPQFGYETRQDTKAFDPYSANGRLMVAVIRELDASDDTYAKANPLGGPATMFDTIARRLRAGENYDEVLADYGLARAAEAGDVTCEFEVVMGMHWPREILRCVEGAEPGDVFRFTRIRKADSAMGAVGAGGGDHG